MSDEPVTPAAEVTARLRRGLDQVRVELEALAEAAGHAGEEVRQRTGPVLERLDKMRADTLSALEQLGEEAEDTQDLLRTDIEREWHQLEAEVALARADLDAAVADSAEAYRQALGRQLATWRSWLDDARVRANLVRKELREEMQELVEEAEAAYRQAQHHLDRGSADPGEPVHALRSRLAGIVDEVGKASAALARRLRDDAGARRS